MQLKIIITLIIPVFFFSCMAPPKNIVYLQDLDNYSQNLRIGNNSIAYDPIIKKKDELLITVAAPTLNQELVAQFNLPPVAFMAAGEIEVQKSSAIQTFIVDQDGTINFPVVGTIALVGLTKSQAIECIKKLVSDHINVDPVINLRIISFKIVVLGEVQTPGVIQVNDEKVSILDAIGAAGDLTIYGNRQNVLLIRENDNGTIDHFRFDLTSPDLFASPFYYLQQNDKIIVEPNKTRQLESKYGPADGYRLSVLSMVFGALSIVASTTIAIISLSR